MTAVPSEHVEWFKDSFDALVRHIGSVLIGKTVQIELALTAVLARGHLLLEDYPGTGKTSLARALAASLGGTVSRIQFTPDLLPGDVTGVVVYNQKDGNFQFHAGPIFANVILADEINRASPKTQSALLEVMEERQVTVDGESRPVEEFFTVIATQNPVEQAGTYRLPEAQLDRFLINMSLGYPNLQSTRKVLERGSFSSETVGTLADLDHVLALSRAAETAYLAPSVTDYIARLVAATRNAVQVRLGASVRGALGLRDTARVRALSKGRGFVTPDDVKSLAEVVLAHRLILEPEYEFEGLTTRQVIRQTLLDVEPPSGSEIPG